MGRKIIRFANLLLLLATGIFSQDSFQDQRQQDLINYPKYDSFYSESGPSRYVPGKDLTFLSRSDQRGYGNREKSPFDYLEDLDLSNRQSAFRERKVQENRYRDRDLPEMILTEAVKNPEYAELLRQLYLKYTSYDPQQFADYYGDLYEKNELRKKNRRYDMGMNIVGLKKRAQNNVMDDSDDSSLYLMNVPNSVSKRFPVTKRSSSYYSNDIPRPFKRSSNKEKVARTDPKVEQDLSSIFSNNSNGKGDKHEERTVTKPKRTEHATEAFKINNTEKTITETPKSKEIISGDSKIGEKEKPIQIKKKSIDWSDYFGIDKRKKSNNLDNEWLMERYHKAVELTSKRNSENGQDKGGKTNGTNRISSTEDKIADMDNKLKNIEYAIVDDALKESRVQETEFDSKEVREIKDRVISQLAAAYSLEKMRRALNEYRESVKKERLSMKIGGKNDGLKEEEKRLSVPRKSAENMETASGDNNIKCTDGDENCVEQNYKTPEDLLDNVNFGYCPRVERACEEIASILGRYEKMFTAACAMHQMCLLCGENTWFFPTRQCNVLYLNKADYFCKDDAECREIARHSIRYLLEMNRLLRADPLDKCDLIC